MCPMQYQRSTDVNTMRDHDPKSHTMAMHQVKRGANDRSDVYENVVLFLTFRNNNNLTIRDRQPDENASM